MPDSVGVAPRASAHRASRSHDARPHSLSCLDASSFSFHPYLTDSHLFASLSSSFSLSLDSLTRVALSSLSSVPLTHLSIKRDSPHCLPPRLVCTCFTFSFIPSTRPSYDQYHTILVVQRIAMYLSPSTVPRIIRVHSVFFSVCPPLRACTVVPLSRLLSRAFDSRAYLHRPLGYGPCGT